MAILRYSAFGDSSADSAGLTAAAGALEGYLGTRHGLKREREEAERDEQEIQMQRQRLEIFERRLQLAEADEAREVEAADSRRALAELMTMEPGVDRSAAMEFGGMPELPEDARKARVKARLGPEDQFLLNKLEEDTAAKRAEAEANRRRMNRAAVLSQNLPDGGEAEMQILAHPESTEEARSEAYGAIAQKAQDVQEQQQLATVMEGIGQLLTTMDPVDVETGEESPEYGFVQSMQRALIDGKVSPQVAATALRPFSPDLDAAMKASGLPPQAAFAGKMAASQAMMRGGQRGMQEQAAAQGGMPQPEQPRGPVDIREHPDGQVVLAAGIAATVGENGKPLEGERLKRAILAVSEEYGVDTESLVMALAQSEMEAQERSSKAHKDKRVAAAKAKDTLGNALGDSPVAKKVERKLKAARAALQRAVEATGDDPFTEHVQPWIDEKIAELREALRGAFAPPASLSGAPAGGAKAPTEPTEFFGTHPRQNL